MSFLERLSTKRITRRESFEVVKDLVIVAIGASIASALPDRSSRVNLQDFEYALDYNVIDLSNRERVAVTLRERAQKFGRVYWDAKDLKKVNSSQLEALPFSSLSYLSNSQKLKKYGIENFLFAWDTSHNLDLAVILKLTNNVRFGEPFKSNPDIIPEWPVLVFNASDENVIGTASATTFSHKPDDRRNNPPLKYFVANFPSRSVLTNQEFLIHFNSRLFNVNGIDLPSFSLPYRFKLEKEKPIPVFLNGENDLP